MADENTLRIEFEDTGGAAGTTPAAPGVSPDVRALLDQLRKGQTEGVGGITAQQARYASIAFQAGGLQTPDVLERFLAELKPVVDKGQQAFALIQSYSPGGKNYAPPIQAGKPPGTPPSPPPPPPPPAGGPPPAPTPDDGRRGPQIPADVAHAAYIRASLARQRASEEEKARREEADLNKDLSRQYEEQNRNVEKAARIRKSLADQRKSEEDRAKRELDDEQKRRLDRARTIAGAAQTIAFGRGAGSLVSGGLQLASTGAFGEVAAGAAGGPAGVAIAAAAVGFDAAVGKFQEAVAEFNARARQLAAYSGPLSAAVAQQDIARLRADIAEAIQAGPEMARLIRAQTAVETQIASALIPLRAGVYEGIADILEPIVDVAKEMKPAIDELRPVLKFFGRIAVRIPIPAFIQFVVLGASIFRNLLRMIPGANRVGLEEENKGGQLLDEILKTAKDPLARPPAVAVAQQQQRQQNINLPAFLNPFGLPPLGGR